MSNRASPRGNPKFGPDAWCDICILALVMCLLPELADVVSQSILDIARPVESQLQEHPDPLLRRRPSDRREAYVPFRCDFEVRRQTRNVGETLRLGDRSLVERRDPGR